MLSVNAPAPHLKRKRKGGGARVQMAGVSGAARKQGQSRRWPALHRPIDQYLAMKINGCRSVEHVMYLDL